MKAGDHILYLSRRDTGSNLYRAHCSEGCKWKLTDVTRDEAKEAHKEHLDAVVAKLEEGRDATTP